MGTEYYQAIKARHVEALGVKFDSQFEANIYRNLHFYSARSPDHLGALETQRYIPLLSKVRADWACDFALHVEGYGRILIEAKGGLTDLFRLQLLCLAERDLLQQLVVVMPNEVHRKQMVKTMNHGVLREFFSYRLISVSQLNNYLQMPAAFTEFLLKYSVSLEF
jgi:hypothetical protein